MECLLVLVARLLRWLTGRATLMISVEPGAHGLTHSGGAGQTTSFASWRWSHAVVERFAFNARHVLMRLGWDFLQPQYAVGLRSVPDLNFDVTRTRAIYVIAVANRGLTSDDRALLGWRPF